MKPVIVMTQTNEVHSHLVDIIHKPFIQLKQLHFNEKLIIATTGLFFRLKTQ